MKNIKAYRLLFRTHSLAASTLLAITPILISNNDLNAAIALGDKGAVAFRLDSVFEYVSNATSSSTGDEDILGIVQPDIVYKFDAGDLNIDAFVGYQFREYDEQSEFDSQNFKSGFEISYPNLEDQSYEIKLDGGYNESTRSDPDLLTIVEKEVTSLNGSGSLLVADRYVIKGQVRYRNEEVEDTPPFIFSDVETLALPIDFFYRYSETLAFGLGYRYRTTEVEGPNPAADSVDHAYYFALEGDLTPVIDADLRIGFQDRNFDSDQYEDNDSFFSEISVGWTISDQSKLQFTGGQEFDTSAANSSIETLYADIKLSHRFDEKLSGYALVGYEENEYSTLRGDPVREDEKVIFELSTDYVLIEDRLTLSGLFRYSDQTSDLDTAEYDRLVILLGLNLIY